MSLGMPVLGEDLMPEEAGNAVDRRDNSIAIFYSQGAARAEIILNIDNNESALGRVYPHGILHFHYAQIFSAYNRAFCQSREVKSSIQLQPPPVAEKKNPDYAFA